MLEQIIERGNIEKALLQVERNKGASGVDGMQTGALRDYLHIHYQSLREEVINGNYRPSPVGRVEIPKPQRRRKKAWHTYGYRPYDTTSDQPVVEPVL